MERSYKDCICSGKMLSLIFSADGLLSNALTDGSIDVALSGLKSVGTVIDEDGQNVSVAGVG